MKKLVKWIGIVVALLVLAVILFLLFGINPLVRMGVVRGGTHATGQTTTLNGANLSLMNGSLELTGLGIGNPAGYKAPQFLTMKDCQVTVEPRSLASNTVAVDSIVIDGLDITLEQNGLKNNLAEILDVIKRNTAAGSTSAGGNAASSEPGRKLKIGVIKLTGTKVHVETGINMTMDLGPIEIKEPTNPDGRPMKIADVIGKVLINVAQQIASNPQLPGGLKDGLKNVNQFAGDLGKSLPGELQNVGKNLGDLFKKK